MTACITEKFALENLKPIIPELEELTKMHYIESHQYPDIPLCIAWDTIICSRC